MKERLEREQRRQQAFWDRLAESVRQCLSPSQRKRKKKRKKHLPRTSSFAGTSSTFPLLGPFCLVPASCLRWSARCLVRQRIHVHASVSASLGFPGPRFLGRFSSLSCVLASPEEYKKIGSPFSVLCLGRWWIHAHASVYGAFGLYFTPFLREGARAWNLDIIPRAPCLQQSLSCLFSPKEYREIGFLALFTSEIWTFFPVHVVRVR